MGLERLCMVLNDADSVYETDLLAGIIDEIVRRSGRPYDRGKNGIPHRVIADHIRSLCFALTDGAFPANEGRGYVVRRILRRAARYGRMLGLAQPFLHALVDTVTNLMGDAYPELGERAATVKALILAEEDRFGQTLDQGLARFEEIKKRLAAAGQRCVPGEDIFLLHDTFGFPPDLVARMAEEDGLAVDMEGYEALMHRQRAQSRARDTFGDELAGGLDLAGVPATRFRGYETTQVTTDVLAAAALPDERVVVVLSETPFYAEAGGQVGDRGVIAGDSFRLAVEDTQPRGEHVLHVGRLEDGSRAAPEPGVKVQATVDRAARARTQRHHTATHLLHAALRAELGTHVEQRGSLVAPERLRFDFTHFTPVSRDELRKVERQVNEAVVANMPVTARTLALEDAKAQGAMALFGEKYGDEVRMIAIGDTSRELCGGTHVSRTGDIGLFRVVSEGSVAAGIRRIEAVSGPPALELSYESEDLLARSAEALKTSPTSLPKRIEALLGEIKALRQKKASSGPAERERGEETIGPVTVQWRVFADAGMQDLRDAWDRLRDRLKGTVLVLAGAGEDRANVLICLSPDLRGRNEIHCGNLARSAGKAMGAGGGGRPDMGQAGGKDPATIPQALAGILAGLRKSLSCPPGDT
jgi:alanyl-tRNA synthetase